MVFGWLLGYNKQDVKEETKEEVKQVEEEKKEEEPLPLEIPKLIRQTGADTWKEDMARIEKDIEDLRNILNLNNVKEITDKELDEWQRRLSPVEAPRNINKNKRKRKK
jgi:hypothetical protein